MEYVIELVTAFLSSIGFALVFNVQRKRLLLTGVGGFLGWGVYLLAVALGAAEVPGYFAAAVVITIYAEAMARIVKCPATIFLATAAIPLVPGGTLYRSMYAFMSSDPELGTAYCVEAILLAAALALGMLFPTAVLRPMRRRKEQENK